MELELNIDLVFIVLGSFLGTVKASLFFDKEDKLCTRTTNLLIGLFCGVTLAYHFGSDFNIWITSLIGLIGSASGAILIEVLLEVLPSTAKTLIKKYLKKV